MSHAQSHMDYMENIRVNIKHSSGSLSLADFLVHVILNMAPCTKKGKTVFTLQVKQDANDNPRGGGNTQTMITYLNKLKKALGTQQSIGGENVKADIKKFNGAIQDLIKNSKSNTIIPSFKQKTNIRKQCIKRLAEPTSTIDTCSALRECIVYKHDLISDKTLLKFIDKLFRRRTHPRENTKFAVALMAICADRLIHKDEKRSPNSNNTDQGGALMPTAKQYLSTLISTFQTEVTNMKGVKPSNANSNRSSNRGEGEESEKESEEESEVYTEEEREKDRKMLLVIQQEREKEKEMLLLIQHISDLSIRLNDAIEKDQIRDIKTVFPIGMGAFERTGENQTMKERYVAYAILVILKHHKLKLDENELPRLCDVNFNHVMCKKDQDSLYYYKIVSDITPRCDDDNEGMITPNQTKMTIEYPAIWGLVFAQLQYFDLTGGGYHNNPTTFLDADKIAEYLVKLTLPQQTNYDKIVNSLRETTKLSDRQRYIIYGAKYLNPKILKPKGKTSWFHANRVSYMMSLNDWARDENAWGLQKWLSAGAQVSYANRIAAIIDSTSGVWVRKTVHKIPLHGVDMTIHRARSTVSIKHRATGAAREFPFTWDGRHATVLA